jgi:hypothetical protein
MGPYAVVDYNITLSRLQSRLPYNLIMGNPMPESTLSLSQGLRIWPLFKLTTGVLKINQLDQIINPQHEYHTVRTGTLLIIAEEKICASLLFSKMD